MVQDVVTSKSFEENHPKSHWCHSLVTLQDPVRRNRFGRSIDQVGGQKTISKSLIVERTTDFLQKNIESWEGKLTKDLFDNCTIPHPKRDQTCAVFASGRRDVLNVPWLALCASMFPHTQPLLCPSLQSIQSDGAKVDHNDPNIRARALQSQSSMEAGKAQVSHRFVRVVNMGTSLRPKKWISAPTSIGSRLVSECYHVHDDNRFISHTKWARRLTCVLAGKSSCEGLLHWPCYGYLKEYSRIRFWVNCSSAGPSPGSSCQKRRIWMAFPEAGCLS